MRLKKLKMNDVRIDFDQDEIDGLIRNDPETFLVMIIDDDKWTSKILTKLMQNFGFKAVTYFDPYDGLVQAVKQKPRIIFLDLLMPELSGNKVLKLLKKFDETKDIPIIIISGNLDEENLADTFRNGAAAFVTKPFTKNILVSKIEQSLGYSVFNYFGLNVEEMDDSEIG